MGLKDNGDQKPKMNCKDRGKNCSLKGACTLGKRLGIGLNQVGYGTLQGGSEPKGCGFMPRRLVAGKAQRNGSWVGMKPESSRRLIPFFPQGGLKREPLLGASKKSVFSSGEMNPHIWVFPYSYVTGSDSGGHREMRERRDFFTRDEERIIGGVCPPK